MEAIASERQRSPDKSTSSQQRQDMSNSPEQVVVDKRNNLSFSSANDRLKDFRDYNISSDRMPKYTQVSDPQSAA